MCFRDKLFFFQELVVEWDFAAILIKVGLCCVVHFGNADFKILNCYEILEFVIPIGNHNSSLRNLKMLLQHSSNSLLLLLHICVNVFYVIVSQTFLLTGWTGFKPVPVFLNSNEGRRQCFEKG